MLIGSIIFSMVPLLYLIIATPLQLYLVQFIYGLSTAVTLLVWIAIFTRHIDKKHEGVEWGVYQTLVNLGSAEAASFGGFLAYRFGFAPLFVLVSFVSLVGSLFLMAIYKK